MGSEITQSKNRQFTGSKDSEKRADRSGPAKVAPGQDGVVRRLLQDGRIQPKLTLGAANDAWESEADRTAKAVMEMADPSSRGTCPACAKHRPRLRQCAGAFGTKTLPGEEPADNPRLLAGVQRLAGRGQPLSNAERRFFEPRFGEDFSGVRLHTGGFANQLADAINARAFVRGNDMVFGTSQYQPGTRQGRTLMAHELSHVIQQQGSVSTVQRAIKFTDPTPVRDNPIKRVLSEPTLGYTLPTVNGVPLPDGVQKAGQLVFSALQPKSTTYDAQTKQCRFAEFDVDFSADLTVITQAVNNQWTMNLPGKEIKGLPTCHGQAAVPVTLTGKPDGQTIVGLVDTFEQEHVDDLKVLYGKHLEPHFQFLMGLRGQGDDASKCQEGLLNALGDKDAKVVDAFLSDWLAAVAKRDAAGGHTMKNTIKSDAGCSYVNIETEKK
ncbi:MAG: DUF4157 domain-containing protein [Gammaproteobacteria bacterium]|nr:DUF4157 domain-containing protein [Gammaproteobacteria bacterium]